MLVLLGGWGLFLVMRTVVLDRVREFPGWSQFLVFEMPWDFYELGTIQPTLAAAVLHSTSVVIVQNTQPPTMMRFTPSVSATTPSVQPTITPRVATMQPTISPIRQTTLPRVTYPTRCANSIETRFAPGDAGYTDPERNIRLRPNPGDNAGTNLAPSTRFVTTGNPVCANLYGYSWNNYLWWPVRLTSGSASGQTGWLAESVINNGQVYRHLFPR